MAELDKTLELFLQIVSLDKEYKKIERLLKQSDPGSYERKKLARKKVDNFTAAGEILARINLLRLHEKGVIKKLEKYVSVDRKKKSTCGKGNAGYTAGAERGRDTSQGSER